MAPVAPARNTRMSGDRRKDVGLPDVQGVVKEVELKPRSEGDFLATVFQCIMTTVFQYSMTTVFQCIMTTVFQTVFQCIMTTVFQCIMTTVYNDNIVL